MANARITFPASIPGRMVLAPALNACGTGLNLHGLRHAHLRAGFGAVMAKWVESLKQTFSYNGLFVAALAAAKAYDL